MRKAGTKKTRYTTFNIGRAQRRKPMKAGTIVELATGVPRLVYGMVDNKKFTSERKFELRLDEEIGIAGSTSSSGRIIRGRRVGFDTMESFCSSWAVKILKRVR